MRPHRLLLAASAAALVLSGCGSSDDDTSTEPAPDPITETARNYAAAVVERDPEAVCAFALVDGKPLETNQQINECKREVRPFLKPRYVGKELDQDSFEDVTDSDASDDEARVTYIVDDVEQTVDLKQVDGEWYVKF